MIDISVEGQIFYINTINEVEIYNNEMMEFFVNPIYMSVFKIVLTNTIVIDGHDIQI